MNEDTEVVLIVAIGIFIAIGLVLALLMIFLHEMGKK